MNRALLQQALDAMTTCSSYVCGEGDDDSIERYEAAIQALKAELAKPEPEPVAWLSVDSIGERYLCFSKPCDTGTVQPLYTK